MYTLAYTFLLLLRVGGASLCSPGYPGACYVEQASFCPMRGVHHHTQQVFYSLQTSLSFGNFCSNRNGSKARVYFFAFSLKKNCLFVCVFKDLNILFDVYVREPASIGVYVPSLCLVPSEARKACRIP